MFSRLLQKYDYIRPIDLLVQGYFFVLSVLLLFFHHGLSYWYLFIGAHILIMYALCVFVRKASESESKIMHFFLHTYPLILYTFMYEEANNFVHIIFPQWFDANVYNLEYMLFGMHPTVLLDSIVSPPVTEFFNAAYFSYYWIVGLPPLWFYCSKKYKALDEYVISLSMAFYISYLGFILFPVRGPRYELALLHSSPLTGFFFTPLQDFIMRTGSMYGGCMPSSHVAAACVVLAMIYRYQRNAWYWMFPVVAALCISTVYCRYHYVLDVVAGIILCWLVLLITPIYNEWFLKTKLKNVGI